MPLTGILSDVRPREVRLIDFIRKERNMGKLKSRKLWATAGVALIISVLSQMGMEDSTLSMISDKLLILIGIYFGGNVGEHVAEAIKAKKQ